MFSSLGGVPDAQSELARHPGIGVGVEGELVDEPLQRSGEEQDRGQDDEVAAGHVDFVGLGRMLLIYPDMARDTLLGRPLERKRICRTFSDCTTAPRNGLVSGCYPLDPFYKARPERETMLQLKKDES